MKFPRGSGRSWQIHRNETRILHHGRRKTWNHGHFLPIQALKYRPKSAFLT
jgi:hypothetical protein